MDGFIRLGTAHTFQLGPFIDDTDGKTAETALTIAASAVYLSKQGGTLTAKNDATVLTGTGDSLGYYDCVLNATDTGTVGTLKVACHIAGALPVFCTFQVVPAAIYDALFGSSASLANAIHDEVVEGSLTLRQAMRLLLSVLTGKSSGGGTATLVFRDIGDTKNRLSVTVDADGNRTAVGTRDGS
jgi:hypothetical protein